MTAHGGPAAIATLGVVAIAIPCAALACGKTTTRPDDVREAPVVAAPAVDAAACDALLARSVEQGDEAYAKADKSCTTKADCEGIEVTGCVARCNPGAIRKSGAASFDAANAAKRKTCAEWHDRGCTYAGPVPTCRFFDVACTGGTCTPLPEQR